jgi:hypothetical protein
MFATRLAAVCLAVLVLAPAASARPTRSAAPTNLHGFLLRADEPTTASFARTPAFAWNPVPGALRYQFQLATSETFRENAIVYSAKSLVTPVAAVPVTLPWIDDMLHGRVRAILAHKVTPWSASFDFDMSPPPAPQPLPSSPGLLRWTPVEGADGYQIWLVDIGRIKITTSYTNVLDEREFYTFHRTPAWTGTVHWRIRALRRNIGTRQNGLPAASYGSWSPIYSSTNDNYRGGQIKLIGTLSDVFSAAGDPLALNHRLMPGFLYSGDQTFDGTSAELFRVYVFTDKGCLNRVFTSAVVGGPAYAPRPHGPLSLPSQPDALTTARGSYLADGAEPPSSTFDGELVQATESLPTPTPTTSIPTDSDGEAAASGPPPTGSTELTTSGGGAPVDLWDTESRGGYWWTVIPVEAAVPGRTSTTVAAPGSKIKDILAPVANGGNFAAGDVVTIGGSANEETAVVTSVTATSLTFAVPLTLGHSVGEPIIRSSGNLRYRDLELAQDVCAKGRVARFAKNSEPALTAAGELFATGLSTKGKLMTAARTTAFYGAPLVAWTPALGAAMYQVQWSKTGNPFKPEPNPQNAGAPGVLAWGTSAVLPLTPRTWYYRVRGFSFSLPTNAQQMSWSDPAKIVVAKPKFRLVGGGK